MAERWRGAPEWEGLYEVSSLGRVRTVERRVPNGPGRTRLVRARVRRLSLTHDGYPTVHLSGNGRKGNVKVQTLVAGAFLGPRPEGHHVCHCDGNKLDNTLGNLRYDTPKGNAADQVAHGTHRSASKAQCDNGHDYTPENTGRRASGWRYCKTCDRARSRAAYERKRAA